MPHIIFSSLVDLNQFHSCFAPSKQEAGGWLIKLDQSFLAQHGETLIVDCTAVRSGFPQDFYIRMENKKGKTTVRVDPYMRIERNEGVQRCIAVIASICSNLQELSVEKTNLAAEYFDGFDVRGNIKSESV